MKITCISDTHMQHRFLTIYPCDIIVHAGDFMRTGKEEELVDFFDWFANQPAQHKLLVAGNHDRGLQKKIEKYNLQLPNSVTLLTNSGIEIGGVRFWGTTFVSHTLAFLNQLKGQTEDVENKIYSQIPSGTDVIITHNAPKGILDFASPDGYSVGSVALLNKVVAIKPKLHIFGHVHYQYGVKKSGNTIFINASLVNNEEELINKPIILSDSLNLGYS